MSRLRYILALATLFLGAAVSFARTEDTNAASDSAASPSGRILWIPDSVADGVISVLEGKSKIVRDNSVVDLDERVILGNDTLPLFIRQRNLGRFERGLFNYLFIPKGVWQAGATVSYGQFSSADLHLLDLLTDFDFTGHTFSIKPYVSYFIKSNLSIGMRLGYSNSHASLGSFNLDIDEDLGFSISDLGYSAESYTAAVMMRNYVGLGRAGRFSIFNEVELAFSSGNTSFRRPKGEDLSETHSTYMQAALNFSPGVCVMVMKNVSFNLSFGVFGFNLKSEKQAVDGVANGTRVTSGANFRFNIFNINFGLGVHI